MRPQHGKLVEPANGMSQATVAEPTIAQPCEKFGVLVVADDHLERIMVRLGLERNGLDVWLAPNGREAIDLFSVHSENIALVLLDVRMPGLDGPETLEALRKIKPEVPACFMSGNTADREPQKLLQRRATLVITKPFLLDDLANILRRLAQGLFADPLPSGKAGQG